MSIEREEPVEEVQQEPVMESSTPALEAESAVRQEPDGPVISSVNPVLESARNELSSNNITGALSSYEKLIKKARYLDEVIYDLREALYRHPVNVDIWQALGDAYMRSNRLQDALDSYTKAEELLR
jgi:DNA-binding SARP family transcriptional activator